MIVRELITKLGFRTDEAAVGRYDAQFAAMRTVALGVATAVTAIGVASVKAFGGLIEQAEQLQRVQAFTGATVEDLQRLKFVAEQSEVSFEELTTAMRFFTMRTGIKPTVALFERLAGELRKLPAEKRLQALSQFFGPRGAPAIVNLLKDGPEGLRRMIEQFDRFGTTLRQNDIEAIDHFGDRLNALRTQFTGIRNHILLEMLPTLEQLGDFIENNPQKAFARLIAIMLAGMLVLGQWRLAIATTLALALQDIRAWQHDQDSIFKDIFGPWDEFVGRVGPTLRILHDLMFGESGTSGAFAFGKYVASVTPAGRAAAYIAGQPQPISPFEMGLNWLEREARSGKYRTEGPVSGPPMVLTSSVTVNVPPGTPQFQADYIGEVVRRSIGLEVEKLNAAFPETEHGG